MASTTDKPNPSKPKNHRGAGEEDFVERRSGDDRRQQPTSALAGLFARGKRKRGRRAGESEGIYVDRFTRGDVALLLGIFILNIFDAFFTMLWLQRGGGEANPFMAYLLEMGEEVFLLQKCIVVGIWLIVLLVHKNFRLARLGLYSLAGVYTLLVIGHFVLIGGDIDPRQPIEIRLPSSEQASE
ncbi:MAG: DUF5658 family protein [Myxococcota bacterium]|nr:DUF5658 family protein [Myxococcota bacterium]